MNCRAQRFLIIAVCSLIFYSHSFAQDSLDLQTDTTYSPEYEDSSGNLSEIPADTAIVETAFDISDDSLQRWKGSRDFAYIAYLDSLLKKQKGLRMDTVSVGNSEKKKSSSASSGGNNFLNSFLLQIFFWAVAIFFICYIIYKLFITNGIFLKRNTKIGDPQTEGEPEGLNEYSEYDNLINDAESKSDYNLSTRYLYLQTLKKLADRDLILYSPDKTNYNYVKELSNQSYRQEFASLTLNYEYAWYGKFEINNERYRKLKGQFFSFNKQV